MQNITSIQWSITTLQYFTFTVFVWSIPLLICVTYTGFDITEYDWLLHVYILLIPGWVRGHRRLSLLFPGTYSHIWVFPTVRVSWLWHLFPALLCLWTNDFRLTDCRRLFPSLYFLSQIFLKLDIAKHKIWSPVRKFTIVASSVSAFVLSHRVQANIRGMLIDCRGISKYI